MGVDGPIGPGAGAGARAGARAAAEVGADMDEKSVSGAGAADMVMSVCEKRGATHPLFWKLPSTRGHASMGDSEK